MTHPATSPNSRGVIGVDLPSHGRNVIVFSMQGRLSFTATEVAAFTGLQERVVRKDIEYGVVPHVSPLVLAEVDLMYFSALADLGFQLKVSDRKRLRENVGHALSGFTKVVKLSRYCVLNLDKMVHDVQSTLERFDAWKHTLCEDPDILAGEPVFPNSRLAVRHIGGMMIRGATLQEIHEDYPYLSGEDIDFAKRYTIAYPPMGRPSAQASS